LTAAKAGRSNKADDKNFVSDKPGLAARLCAQRLLAAVIETSTSLDGLTDDDHGHPQYRALEMRDRSLVRAILSSALRHRGTVSAFLTRLLDKPLPENAKSLNHLLHVAAAQILFLDIPDHSAVDLAVEAARADPRNGRFASLVNALLRRMAREKADVLPTLLATTRDVPDWFWDELRGQYGERKAEHILAMHRVEAPVDFTVKTDPSHWAQLLGGIVLPCGTVRVEKLDVSVPNLPGFAEGAWWVQDAAASIPAMLLGNIKNMQALDLCAAPGGKTAQMVQAGGNVTAVDLSASRLRRLTGNLKRLGLSAKTWQGNAFDFKPETLFDAVLLDAPCSSTGTIRRHPDVAWTKSPQDVAKLAKLQFEMLGKAVEFVKPGGVLVFSNCSLLAVEGEELARRAASEITALEPFPVMPEELPGLETLVTTEGWLRSTPADMVLDRPEISGMDGFFAARFRVR
jgi:16S rRNA (cytosine967-C5)-methyltransferase